MKESNQIDELLKENFKDFAPDAPNVWSAVQKGLEVAGQASAGSAATVVAGKGLFSTMSIIVASTVIVAVTAGYLWMQNNSQSAPKVPIESPVNIGSNELPIEAKKESAKEGINKIPQTSELNTKHETRNTKTKTASMDSHTESVSSSHQKSNTTDNKLQDNNSPSSPNNESNNQTNPISEKDDSKYTGGETLVKDQPTLNKKESTDDGNGKQESIVADNIIEPDETFIPNSFTPYTLDGFNDRFVIVIKDEVFYSLTIVDTNGKLIFESNNKEKTWDGTNSFGEKCGKGTYRYIFEYQLKGSEKPVKRAGYIIIFE
jgi:gliding motility-associated-like protein